MNKEEILEEAASHLTLYFVMGGNESFQAWDKLYRKHFKIREENEISAYAISLFNGNPTQWIMNIWQTGGRSDFEREKKHTRSILNQLFTIQE